MLSPNTLLLKEKPGVGTSVLIICHCARGGVHGEIVSVFPTHFNGDIFSFTQCVGDTQLLIYFRENCAMCSWRFSMSRGGGVLRSLLCHQIGVEPKTPKRWHLKGIWPIKNNNIYSIFNSENPVSFLESITNISGYSVTFKDTVYYFKSH